MTITNSLVTDQVVPCLRAECRNSNNDIYRKSRIISQEAERIINVLYHTISIVQTPQYQRMITAPRPPLSCRQYISPAQKQKIQAEEQQFNTIAHSYMQASAPSEHSETASVQSAIASIRTQYLNVPKPNRLGIKNGITTLKQYADDLQNPGANTPSTIHALESVAVIESILKSVYGPILNMIAWTLYEHHKLNPSSGQSSCSAADAQTFGLQLRDLAATLTTLYGVCHPWQGFSKEEKMAVIQELVASEYGVCHPWQGFSKEEKMAVIQELVASDISAHIKLEKGEIRVVDLIDGKELIIACQGSCAADEASLPAILSTIEKILRSQVSPDITVTRYSSKSGLAEVGVEPLSSKSALADLMAIYRK